jgi:small nuclear ribonucleoprotein (snRNP)-like protein
MDKYHGVYVKIVLSNNDTVKGHIYGKDESGNLILKNGKDNLNRQESNVA